MDDKTLIVAGVGIAPLIVALIQFAKRFAPNADGRVWLGTSAVLGVAFWVAAYFADRGAPANASAWLALVVLGLNFALTAAAAYDRTIGNPASSPRGNK